jgi:hypothetical protein
MTQKLTTLLALALLLGSCSILPGGKGDPAPSATPQPVAPLAPGTGTRSPTALPTSSSAMTMTSTPTPSPTMTPTPTPPPLVEVTGPGAYPGDLPYLAAIEARLSRATSPLVVEAGCEGTLLRQGATSEQTLHPGQSVAFFFVIPPGHAPECRVVIVIAGEVAGQECGQWTVALGGEEPMTMACAVETGGDEP